MSISSNEIILMANQTPGEASFNNFNEVKEYLRIGLAVYNNTEYTVDNVAQAREDLQVLKNVKKKLTDKKRELEKAYTMPIDLVMAQLDELIDMVKEPYGIIDRMLKDNAKVIKRNEIMNYATQKAVALGLYREKVINSPAFFNSRWLNATYKDRDWQRDVNEIINRAVIEIPLVKTLAGDNSGPILGFYFDKLSFSGIESFIKTLDETNSEEMGVLIDPMDINPDTGEIIDRPEILNNISMEAADYYEYRIVKLVGDTADIDTYINNAKLCKISIIEIERGIETNNDVMED